MVTFACLLETSLVSIAFAASAGEQFSIKNWWLMDYAASFATFAKDVATVATAICIVLYFNLRRKRGFETANLSVAVTSERWKNNTTNKDAVTFTVTLRNEKGSLGTVNLEKIEVRVTDAQTGVVVVTATPNPQCFTGIRRLHELQSGNVFPGFDWNNAAKDDPTLNVAPGDEMSVASLVEVGSAQICKIEVVVGGTRWNDSTSTGSQWRAETISLPKSL